MSKEAKHTPGPWDAEIDSDHDSACDIEITAKGAVVISVLGSDSFACFDEESEGWERFSQEQVANANLVAAAPDMLEALQEAESMLETAMRTDLVFDRKTQDEIIANHPGMVKIRAAITKAKGGGR